MHPRLQQLLFGTLLCALVQAEAQTPYTLALSLPGKAQFATADQLSNTYVLRGAALEKHDSTGTVVARYSNNRLGAAASVDASNPLKILVWYAAFQTAVFLDRNLTELGRLNLATAGWPAVRSIASASDGNLWVYDEAAGQLLKLSPSGEKLLESQPISLAFGQAFSPDALRDDGGQGVYAYDLTQGLAVFDPFAQPIKTIPRLACEQFEVADGVLFFLESEHLATEDLRGGTAMKTHLPSPREQVWLSPRRLFVQTQDELKVYRF